MKQTKWLYMHTIDGHPAQYEPGRQIHYANGTRGQAGVTRLITTDKEIKKQQRLSARWRAAQGFGSLGDYGYVRIAKSALK